jgi:hypothetical protein
LVGECTTYRGEVCEFSGSSGKHKRIPPIFFTRPRITGSATPLRRSLAQWPAPRPRKHIVAISIASFHKRAACPFLSACHHCYFICSKEIVWKLYGKFLIDFYASKAVRWQTRKFAPVIIFHAQSDTYRSDEIDILYRYTLA